VSYLERLRTLKGPPAGTDKNDTKRFPSFSSVPTFPVPENAGGPRPGSRGGLGPIGKAVRGLSVTRTEPPESPHPADREGPGWAEVTADTLRVNARGVADRQAPDRAARFYQDVFAGQGRRALVSLHEDHLERAVRLGLITRARAEGHQVLAYRTGRANCLLLIAAGRYYPFGVFGILHETTSGASHGDNR
jgi:hypothetical protein